MKASFRGFALVAFGVLALAGCGPRLAQSEAPKTANASPADDPLAAPEEWWKRSDACPEGAKVVEANGPQGREVACRKPDGTLHGGLTTWHTTTGKKADESEYRLGKLDGHQLVWHDNGQLKEDSRYRGGKLEGPRTVYWPNGNKKLEGEFRSNVETGRFVEYGEKGEKVSEVEYQMGKEFGKKLTFYEDGALRTETEYRGGERHGQFKSYYASGKLEEEGKHKRGKRTGLWTLYHETGKKKEDRQFVDDKLDGPFTAWSETGVVTLEGNYKQAKKDGIWTTREPEEGEAIKIETFKKGILFRVENKKPKNKSSQKPAAKTSPAAGIPGKSVGPKT